MDDVRGKAIEAAYEELSRLSRKIPGVAFEGGFDAGYAFCIVNLENAITAYERVMLEAGWKMCPKKPTKTMLFRRDQCGGDTEEIWPDMWDAVPKIDVGYIGFR